MKGGNEVSEANGITQFAEGEPQNMNPLSDSTDNECEFLFCFSGGLRTPARLNSSQLYYTQKQIK